MALTIHQLSHCTPTLIASQTSWGSNVYNESDPLKRTFSGFLGFRLLWESDDSPIFWDGNLEFSEHHDYRVDERYNDCTHIKVQGDIYPFLSPFEDRSSVSTWDDDPGMILYPGGSVPRHLSTRTAKLRARGESISRYHTQAFAVVAWRSDPWGTIFVYSIATMDLNRGYFTSNQSITSRLYPLTPLTYRGELYEPQPRYYNHYGVIKCSYKDEGVYLSKAKELVDYYADFDLMMHHGGTFNRGNKLVEVQCPTKKFTGIGIDTNLLNAMVTPKHSESWGILAGEAYASAEDIGFSSNGIAYAKDLLDLSTQAKRTLQSAKSIIGKTRGKMAAISSLFLSFYYGWSLTVRDSQELLQLAGDYSKTPARRTASRFYQEVGYTFQQFYSVYFYPHKKLTSDLGLFMKYFDLDLDLGNIWDMIPFSFVVDWFVGIGDVAERCAGYMDMNYIHEVIASSRTTKLTRSLLPTQLGLPSSSAGNISLSKYERKFSPYAEEPSFLPTVNPNFTHWVEAGALILSRK